ncbi:hypothetical protein [Salipiger thiooxidans]|uniref:hypothetical protein n=1 Tax=Salipiger thiooxidans TaxID=282683 RepID=UPI001CD68188|nr:hypothetical protein [Salipiger thiooxidans]MCA0849917.1 hypothetical protein [Salipiger thiooxidans]
MRQTLMLNLDEKHAKLLQELRDHFRLSAEETARFAIRLTHARCKEKPDVLVPEFKPRSKPRHCEPGEPH